jgi:DNA mismatch repair protein MutS
VRRGAKEIFAKESFDLVLAYKLTGDGARVVCNDFSLNGPERVLVISGPNQGGKTTFARMFGQVHHLANIGCPVPGSEAELYLFDGLYTHFEREEDLSNATGKLEDDLLRAKRILSTATTDSLVVLNEPFSSTTLQDSLFLGAEVMERLIELDVLSVFVTFVEELSSFGSSAVSMVGTVVPDNPAERTYKVVRRRADGLAYALALAQKYRVSYQALRARLTS